MMTYVVSGYANLHKTHATKVGYNLCDPNPHESNGFDINCSLVCTLGQPFISGMASFFTYREDCDGNLINTRLLTPNMFYIPIGCPSNYNEDTPYNDTWAGSSSYTTPHGTIDGHPAGYRLKMDAVMTAISVGLLSLTITTSRLMPGSLTYVVCNSITMAMTETSASVASDGYDARYYESELLETSFDQDNCGGEVKKVRATVVLMSYHFGCSITYTPGADKCNLRTTRGGAVREYSCLVGLASPADGSTWLPQVVQLGVNPVNCHLTDRCGCYYWDGYQMHPSHSMPADLLIVGCPDEPIPFASPPSTKQRIQTAILGSSSYGSYEVVLKTIGLGSICVAARLVGMMTGPWVIGSLTIVKSVNPFIMTANFSGLLAGNPVFQFYGMEFPTSVLQDCIDAIAGPPPMEPHALSNLPIIEAPPPLPIPPQESPAIGKAREMVKRIYEVKARPCKSLGMALEKTASCGCGGAVLHECSTHGQCRQSGNDPKTKLCWQCPDYSAK